MNNCFNCNIMIIFSERFKYLLKKTQNNDILLLDRRELVWLTKKENQSKR